MKLNGLNILPADDDDDDCFFFKKAVTACVPPHNFSAVHNGKQLVQLHTDETNELADVLFPDLNMPRKNGFECLSEIKQYQKLKNLPVVTLSTSGSNNDMRLLFRKGADVYIRKPSNFEQMVQVIQHALPMASESIVTNAKLKYILNA